MEQVNEDFKLAVKQYIEITDEISGIQKQIKDKRKKMKDLAEFILGFMKTNDKEVCNLGDSGLLMIKQKKTKVAFKKDNLYEMLKNVLSTEDVDKSIEYIFKHQEVKESEYLHRSNNSV